MTTIAILFAIAGLATLSLLLIDALVHKDWGGATGIAMIFGGLIIDHYIITLVLVVGGTATAYAFGRWDDPDSSDY